MKNKLGACLLAAEVSIFALFESRNAKPLLFVKTAFHCIMGHVNLLFVDVEYRSEATYRLSLYRCEQACNGDSGKGDDVGAHSEADQLGN